MSKFISLLITIFAMLIGMSSTASLTDTIRAQASTVNLAAKQIRLDGHLTAKPNGLVHHKTTYLPLVAVMQTLSTIEITSKWDGVNWQISTPAGSEPDLSHLNPGTGAKHIYVNGVLVKNTDAIVMPAYAGGQPTTFMPIWYIMNVMKRLHLNGSWNGVQWALTSPPPPRPIVLPASGVADTAIQRGSEIESWWSATQTPSVDLQSLHYLSKSNAIPISGTVDQGYTGDVVVQVADMSQNNSSTPAWSYSVPVKNGKFSATILLPFHGLNSVDVGVPQAVNGANWTLNNNFVYADFTNNSPSLSRQQMDLLQSWLVNYNESQPLQLEAAAITRNAVTTDQKIRDVSNWVSEHIAYNWPSYWANNEPWQQTSQTFLSRIGVCEDESALAAAMLRSIGIPTELVDGTGFMNGSSGAHQWNQAWDGTHWVLFDPTWDQVYANTVRAALPAYTTDQFFNLPAPEFALTHKQGFNPYW